MSTTTERDGKTKVLCLHGFAQDGTTFRAKIGAIRKQLKSACEFYFLDAPHDVAGAFDADGAEMRELGASNDASGSFAWFTSGENARAGAKRASDDGWTRPALSREYDGLDETREKIRAFALEHGPFGGVIGFSQGATIALAALAVIEELRGSARWAVLVAGFEPLDTVLKSAAREATPIAIKTLHVHGENDKLVTRERMMALAEHFEESQREFWFHEGAHGVPSTALAKHMKAWLQVQR